MSELQDFVIKDNVLEQYLGSDSDVVILEGISAIGARAFKDNNIIRSRLKYGKVKGILC